MKTILFLICSIGLIACVSVHNSESAKTSLPYPKKRTPAYDSKHNVEKLSFSKLVDILKSENVENMEDALKILSERYTSYMKLHTLMYESFSLHESSFEEPRVIVFGPDADFILTFNGGTRQKAGNAFETMEFDSETGNFLFREISFKKTEVKKDEPSMLKETDIEFESDNLKITTANPQKCMNCHGSNPRPIWDTYFFWAGAYGSNDDILTSLFDKTAIQSNGNLSTLLRNGGKPGDSQGRLIALKPGAADRESLEFSKFIQNKKTHPRYQYLPDRTLDTSFHQLNAGENRNSIDVSQGLKDDFNQMGFSHSYQYLHARPNLALLDLLYHSTIQSLVKKNISNPTTMPVVYKMAWISQYCGTHRESLRQYSAANERDPFQDLKPIFSNEEIIKIKKTAGDWKVFSRKFLKDEMSMQAEKMERAEKVFGVNSLANAKDYRKSRIQPSYMQNILGRKLNMYEALAINDEDDDLLTEALIAYIATGVGLDLADYTVNLRRVPSFREGGFRDNILEALSSAGLINKYERMNLADDSIRTEMCSELLRKATQ